MRTNYNLLQLLYLSLFLSFNLYAQSDLSLKPPPNWVSNIDFEPSENSDESPYLYLITQEQENEITEEEYYHYAVQLFNSEGVQEMSSISIFYDPNYQTVTVHDILVHRDNNIQKRDISDFQFLRQETDIQRAIYDGTITAIKELKDIRAGDIIEFAYTIKGHNPIYGDDNFSNFYQEYNLPVKRIYKSVISDREMSLSFQNNAIEPEIVNEKGKWIYKWDILNVDSKIQESSVPFWIEQYKLVTMSTMKNWFEVVDWALDLYKISNREKKSLKKELSDRLSLTNNEEGIIEAIRFVQDDIRYLGFEEGIKAFKPTRPSTVLSQRFGDCKDKSFLLSSILNTIGVDASPMLVNTSRLETIQDYVPSPNAFDHCIVTFNKNGAQYFVDPTIAHQGGNLQSMTVPQYKLGLPIKKGIKKLQKFEEDLIPLFNVQEIFEIDSINGGGVFRVISKYNGIKSDNIRSYFNSNSRSDIKSDYVDFYLNEYPGIENTSLEIIDTLRESTNEITVKESYTIPMLWEENNGVLSFTVSALLLSDHINLSKPKKYDNNYWLGNQVEFLKSTEIRLPEIWSVSASKNEVHNKYFDYRNVISYDNNIVKLNYRYYLKDGDVAADDVKETLIDIDKINEDLSFELTYDKSFFKGNGSNSLAYVIWGVLMFSLVIGFVFTKWIYYTYDPKPETIATSIPIGGWLILPSIGLIFAPFRMLYEQFLLFNDGAYSSATFKSLWTGTSIDNGKAIMILIAGESMINILLFMTSIIIAILFFKRRSNVPFLMMCLYLFSFSFIAVDSILASFLIEDTSIIDRDVLQLALSACIWIPYFMFSQRVKNTFNVQLAKSSKVIEEEE